MNRNGVLGWRRQVGKKCVVHKQRILMEGRKTQWQNPFAEVRVSADDGCKARSLFYQMASWLMNGLMCVWECKVNSRDTQPAWVCFIVLVFYHGLPAV